MAAAHKKETGKFQSLSGNSSVVGQSGWDSAGIRHFCFNPFQGIQVLSAGISGHDHAAVCPGFNPFQGIQVLSDAGADDTVLYGTMFQSLSGNSSVVGWKWHGQGFSPHFH